MATDQLHLHEHRRAELDQALAVLRQNKRRWAQLPVADRIALLDQLLRTIRAAAPAWVERSQTAKGLDPNSPRGGEEWLNGPYLVARNTRLLHRSLVDVSKRGVPRLPGRPFVRNGRVVAPVFPTDLYDRILFGGYRAEVVMQPQITLDQLESSMAVAYREPDPQGVVCLVLGAGNVSSIGPMDVLYKLFVENQVVLLKLHPLLEYLRDVWTDALRPLIDWGALRIVTGGRDEGSYLTQHESVDEIHMTGSVATHDAIVFGTGADAAWRKEHSQPLLNKRVSSELGNVSAMIVMPGRWRTSDILFQAENVASSLVNNAGFNCNATRVVITHRQWPQRDEFLAALRNVFSNTPPRTAYYPGAADRHAMFLQNHPDAELYGRSAEGCLPWTFISGLNADATRELCYQFEAFCSVTSETALTADDDQSFLRRAVNFVNETLTGSLNAAIIAPPSAMTAQNHSVVDQAIHDLRVGTVAINHWPAIGYAFCSTTWGAFPGHAMNDIQSGRGVVHNTYMFSAPEKSIVYGPFRPWPKPPWLVSHRGTHKLGPRLLEFECRPSPLKLPAIFRFACEL